MSNQCCCGRTKPCDEAYIHNDTKHEPLGPEGNFCGPVVHHTLRDALKENESLRSELAALRKGQGEREKALREALEDYRQALKDHANDGCYCCKANPETRVCRNDCGPANARKILSLMGPGSSGID